MKILWHGIPSRIKTGFGTQTGLFVPKLQQMGHEVAISAILDQWCNGIDENSVLNYSSGPKTDLMGADYFLSHVADYQPDIVMSMCDICICPPQVFEKVRWFPWVMAHEYPLHPATVATLQACERPIAPTRHTEGLLEDAGFDPLYIPLAYDPDVFKPVDRSEARQLFEKVTGRLVDDNTFIVMMNATNHSTPPRKNFGAALAGFKALSIGSGKANVRMYLHTDMHGTCHGGMNLYPMVERWGLAGCMAYPPQYDYVTGTLTSEYLNWMYNAADVLLVTSTGEGFCLPIIEAKAAGCPVIAPAVGSCAEVNRCERAMTLRGTWYMADSGCEIYIINPDDVHKQLKAAMTLEPRRAINDGGNNWKYSINEVAKSELTNALGEINTAMTPQLEVMT